MRLFWGEVSTCISVTHHITNIKNIQMVEAMTVYLKEAREFQWIKQRNEEGGSQEDRA